MIILNVIIEVIVAIILIGAGYAGVCQYLKEDDKKIDKEYLLTMSNSKIYYLVISVCIYILLIIILNTVYNNNGLINHLKPLCLIGCIIPCAAVDQKVNKIPNKFLVAALCVRVVLYIGEFINLGKYAAYILFDNLAGAFIIAGFFLLILLIFKNSIGMGDIKLFAVMGLYQGIWGAFNSIFFSLMASLIIAIVLLIRKKKNRHDAIPFGPSILIGTVIAVCLAGI